jgi:hypothetical protein
VDSAAREGEKLFVLCDDTRGTRVSVLLPAPASDRIRKNNVTFLLFLTIIIIIIKSSNQSYSVALRRGRCRSHDFRKHRTPYGIPTDRNGAAESENSTPYNYSHSI